MVGLPPSRVARRAFSNAKHLERSTIGGIVIGAEVEETDEQSVPAFHMRSPLLPGWPGYWCVESEQAIEQHLATLEPVPPQQTGSQRVKRPQPRLEVRILAAEGGAEDPHDVPIELLRHVVPQKLLPPRGHPRIRERAHGRVVEFDVVAHPPAVREHVDRRKLPRERSAKLVVDGALDDEMRIGLRRDVGGGSRGQHVHANVPIMGACRCRSSAGAFAAPDRCAPAPTLP